MTYFRTSAAIAALILAAGQPVLAQDATPESTEAPAETTTAEAAPETTADTVVATVNGTDITIGHMILAREQIPQQYQQLPDNVLFDGILKQLVQQAALADTVKDVSPALELAMENFRRTLLAGSALEAAAAEAVTEEAVQAAYDAAYADAEPGTEYNAAHILVETEEEAQALKEELDGGADFETLAREKSTGPSGPNGGALGWFGPGMMVEPFETAVQGMEAGEVSDPVETQFGWHVIKLNETREKDAPALEEVYDELAAKVQQDAIEGYIAELTEAADVTETDTSSIDPAAIRDVSLLDQ